MKIISNTPDLKTLTSCLEYLKGEGYTDDFRISGSELLSSSNRGRFRPEQVKINNFYRFEGPSNPDDNSILYAIETEDGTKGTLIDAYGVYSDSEVGSFIVSVEDIQKKAVK